MRKGNQTNQIELLETRRLMSGTAVLTAGALQITGTDGSDVISIYLEKTDPTLLSVKINRDEFTFNVSDVKTAQVDALGGNDKVVVDQKNGPIFIDLVVNGGAGNDTITTGAGNDIIDGGDGNDMINAGAGDDYITGGNGNDTTIGGDGNDTIIGGTGRDSVNGGTGNDNLDGGAGRDSIKTGTGTDSVAIDSSNAKEVKDHNPLDQSYRVTDFSTLPTQLQSLHESIVPGSHVFRVEYSGTNYSLYYHFDGDPVAYKTVVTVQTDGNIDLVSREVSLNEARQPAIDAFNVLYPNMGLVSLNQSPHGSWDVRYRDMSGNLQTVTTTDLVWGLDDASRDANNDGYTDQQYQDNTGPNGTNQGGTQNGDGTTNGGPKDQNGNPIVQPTV